MSTALRLIKWGFAAATILLALPIIASIMSIGSSLRSWRVEAEWTFYGLILLVLLILLIKFLLPVLLHPAWPARLDACNEEQLRQVAKRQIARGVLHERNAAAEQAALALLQDAPDEGSLRLALAELRRCREPHLRRVIRNHAVQAGLATAISRNDLLDFFMILALCGKLVREITDSSGLRPSYRQMISLYAKLLRASYYAYYLDSATDTAVSTVGSMVGGALESVPLIGHTSKMAANGFFNAIIVTRIGFIAEELVWGNTEHLSIKELAKRSIKFATDTAGDMKSYFFTDAVGVVKRMFR